MFLPSLLSNDVLHELVQAAMVAPEGNFAEVGVYNGGSASRLYYVAQNSGRELYLFDTFTGIPFCDPLRGDEHRVGDFDDADLTTVKAAMPKAKLCIGTFPDTLPDTGPLALVHVDCDQYQSVKDCITHLWPRMVDGGLMIFDDYTCLIGARRAVDELMPGKVVISPAGKAWMWRRRVN